MIKTEFKDENVVNNYENKRERILIPFLSHREYLMAEIIDIDHLGDKLELKNPLSNKTEIFEISSDYINMWDPKVGDYYCHKLHNNYEGCIKKSEIKNYIISPIYITHAFTTI